MAEVKELDHMGDLLLESCGKNFEEALKGLLETLGNFLGKAKEEPKEFIEFLKTGTKEEVVVESCEEVLFLYDTTGKIPARVNVKKTPKGWLFRLYLAEAEPKNEIKAVTWHLLQVKAIDGKTCIRVLFDL